MAACLRSLLGDELVERADQHIHIAQGPRDGALFVRGREGKLDAADKRRIEVRLAVAGCDDFAKVFSPGVDVVTDELLVARSLIDDGCYSVVCAASDFEKLRHAERRTAVRNDERALTERPAVLGTFFG